VTLDHPIFTRWPAQYPDRLQLFSAPTPNGVKVGIMLEEISLAYEPHRIDIIADESHDPAFLALNPNGKIPAIYDPHGPARPRPRASGGAARAASDGGLERVCLRLN
jgi:GSH-dependent disulfide-bond oxidoreductase